MTDELKNIAWGKKFSPEEKEAFLELCTKLKMNPDWLMACIAFETGETFSTSIKNAAQSNATGLIQFVEPTAVGLGTTLDKLEKMEVIEQLVYVGKYFEPYAKRIKTFSDMYMAILWPAAIGRPEDYILFDKNDRKYPKRYIQNKGLDFDKNGLITKAEASAKAFKKLEGGKKPEYYG